MKVGIALLSLILVARAFVTVEEQSNLFASWASKHSKSYSSTEERNERFQNWQLNFKRVSEWNSTEAGFEIELNELADWSDKEYRARNTHRPGMRKLSDSVIGYKTSGKEPPPFVDWRLYGIVNPVKNQGHCGCCWAFSAISVTESAWAQATGDLDVLSEQQLVDCGGVLGNNGCNGGLAASGIEYIILNGGVELNSSYPYAAKQGACQYDPTLAAATIYSMVNLTLDFNGNDPGDEFLLQDAVANVGPISIAIDASHSSLQLYSSGVYYEPECKNGVNDLDHAVVLVGYGTTYWGEDYWIVRNSWGRNWGLDGYIWMARNRGNNCGVASDALFPLIY